MEQAVNLKEVVARSGVGLFIVAILSKITYSCVADQLIAFFVLMHL